MENKFENCLDLLLHYDNLARSDIEFAREMIRIHPEFVVLANIDIDTAEQLLEEEGYCLFKGNLYNPR